MAIEVKMLTRDDGRKAWLLSKVGDDPDDGFVMNCLNDLLFDPEFAELVRKSQGRPKVAA